MLADVIRRSGARVPFDEQSLQRSVRFALAAGGEAELARAEQVTAAVLADLATRPADVPLDVETIEETIEFILAREQCRAAAHAYLRFRLKKEQAREARDELGEIVGGIIAEQSRENANFSGSPSARMQQIAATASRIYYTDHLVPREFMLAHEWGELHIHDLDYYALTVNCLQIDLGKLLATGCNPGHGYLPPPADLAGATAFAATIILANQNDMFGGQSFPHFDRDLGAFIRARCPATTAAQADAALGAFVLAINTLHSRAGGNVPFSTVNIGSDTTPEGRLVTRALLDAFARGLGRGETPLFPNIVFRLQAGVNFNPADPNYDLFRQALRVAGRRMNPTFSFLDASFNRAYGDGVAYMGCRTRVMANRCGPEVAAGRGNLAAVTLNLPGLALRTKTVDGFLAELDRLVDLAARQLLHRFGIVAQRRARDLPFLMGEQIYCGSDTLGPDDPVGPALQHGTLAIGFIGLAEALLVLCGKHHGEDEAAWRLGLRIIGRLRELTDALSAQHDLNFTCYATPAEGLSGRFTAIDRDNVGTVPRVTDKGYYTNSFHVPVDCPVSAFTKIEREAPFHRLCNAGHIGYVELPAAPEHNPAAIEKLLRHMAAQDMGYAGINFPLDECRACHAHGVFAAACPQCGGTEVHRLRRITGYLSTSDRFNPGKRAELRDRVPHPL